MSFPPGSVTRDMAIFLEMATLESAVLELRPELAGTVTRPEPGRPLLAFDVADHERVVVALVRGDGPGDMYSWVVEDGRPGDHAARWPRGTRPGMLAEAVVDRIDTIVTGRNE